MNAAALISELLGRDASASLVVHDRVNGVLLEIVAVVSSIDAQNTLELVLKPQPLGKAPTLWSTPIRTSSPMTAAPHACPRAPGNRCPTPKNCAVHGCELEPL